MPKGPREDKQHSETVVQYTERMNAFVGALTKAKTLALKAEKATIDAAVKVASEAARKAEEAALEAARKAALEAARKAALEAARKAEEAALEAAREAAREAERAAALEAARAAEEEELRTSKKARVPKEAQDAVFWAKEVLYVSAHVLGAASTRTSDPDNTSHKKPVGLVPLSSLDELSLFADH